MKIIINFTCINVEQAATDDRGYTIPLEPGYIDNKEKFQDMLKAVESEISQESHIQLIRKKRLELIDMATSILTTLESHIES